MITTHQKSPSFGMLLSVAIVFLLALNLQLPVSAQPATADETSPAAGPTADDALDAPPIAPQSDKSQADQLPAWKQPGHQVAIIPVEGDIYGFTLDSLKRRVDRARAEGATLIVLEVDTYGGLVTTALETAKYLKNLDLPTMAWVNDKAYSAGSLISAATDAIVMSPSSAIGDCAPIVPGQDLPPTERAKALSPILTEFEDNAANNGYDYALFHAMCELGVEVYMVEHKQNGTRRLVNQADYQYMVNSKDVSPAEQQAQVQDNVENIDQQELEEAPVTTRLSRKVSGLEDQGQWMLVRQVHDGRTLLTMHQGEAQEVGLSQATIGSGEALGQWLSAKSVITINQTWSENLAGWLSSPAVRAVLVLALMLGAYVELQSPGVGLPGAVAVSALVLLLGAPFLVGLAEIWHLLLVGVGVALLLLEIFVIPGFGLAGLSGVVFILTGLALSIVPTGGGSLPLPAPEMFGRLQSSIAWMLVGVISAAVSLMVLARYMDTLPMFSRLVLTTQQSLLTGTPGAGPLDQRVGGDESIGGGRITVGQVGQTKSELRPTGRAMIDGQLVDVVSSGEWIGIGEEIRVAEVHGNRIVVHRVQEATA